MTGDNAKSSITISTFQKMISNFPTSYELKLYVESRMAVVLRNEFEMVADARSKFEKYMNKKSSRIGEDLFSLFKTFELQKYEMILRKLKNMLANQVEYNEKQWQLEILQFIQLIYPKYINVFSEVTIKDVYSGKNRRLDYLLIDSNGNVDLIEIKRPFDECILTNRTYRDNYIPMRELSSAVMQIEKYIFWLNKWGRSAEKALTEKYKDELPINFEIKVINPGAIIIMGREKNFTAYQKSDFEIIKRKYKNVVDILTYDELIRRLELLVNKYK